MKETAKDIFIKNFFIYLTNKNIKQNKYENDNELPLATLSKWKNGTLSPTIENLYQAAKYFNITVNDLAYDDDEKKTIEVLTDNNYSPINAQQIIDFKIHNQLYRKPLLVTVIVFFLLISFMLMMYILNSYDNNFIYLFLFIPIISFFLIYKSLYSKRKFIINYTDSVVYKKTSNIVENKRYNYQFWFRIFLFFMSFISLILVNRYTDQAEHYSTVFIYVFLSLFIMFISLVSIFYLTKNIKEKITDNNRVSYLNSLLIFIYTISISSFILFVVKIDISTVFYFVVYVLCLLLSFMDFIIESNIYKDYKVVYIDSNRDEKDLKI